MLRSIFAVVVPILGWGFLWFSAGLALKGAMPDSFEGDYPTGTGALLSMIVISCILSNLAGFVCAKIAAHKQMKHVMILAGIQLLIGIAVEASAWTKMPVWYHLIFLALVVPMHFVGGKMGSK